ncbi:hypothetical protein KIPB_007526, partial [Kipferlia bialata]
HSPTLAHLSLRCCALGDTGVRRVSHALAECMMLKTLDLAANDITMVSLQTLAAALIDVRQGERERETGARHRGAERERETLGLEMLSLELNPLGQGAGPLLAAVCRGPSSPSVQGQGVTHLSLGGCSLGDSGASTLLSGCILHPRCMLQSVTLWGNGITSQGACDIASTLTDALSLSMAQDLCHLDLSHNCIGASGAAALYRAVGTLPSVTDTHGHTGSAVGSSIHTIPPREREGVVESRAGGLSTLNISGNPIGGCASYEIDDLSKHLGVLLSLRRRASATKLRLPCDLNLSGCHMMSAAIEKVSSAFALHPHTLPPNSSKRTNGRTASGSVPSALLGSSAPMPRPPSSRAQDNNPLRHQALMRRLTRGQNQIHVRSAPVVQVDDAPNDVTTDDTASAEQALSVGFTSLNLDDNGSLGDTGGVHACACVRLCQSIQSVVLSRCMVGHATLTSLGALVAVRSTLRHIDLSGNNLSDAAGCKLARRLSHAKGLRVLILDGNRISDPCATVLASALKSQSAVMDTLSLSRNNIGYVGAVALSEGVTGAMYLRRLHLKDNPIPDSGVTVLSVSVAELWRRQQQQYQHANKDDDDDEPLYVDVCAARGMTFSRSASLGPRLSNPEISTHMPHHTSSVTHAETAERLQTITAEMGRDICFFRTNPDGSPENRVNEYGEETNIFAQVSLGSGNAWPCYFVPIYIAAYRRLQLLGLGDEELYKAIELVIPPVRMKMLRTEAILDTDNAESLAEAGLGPCKELLFGVPVRGSFESPISIEAIREGSGKYLV